MVVLLWDAGGVFGGRGKAGAPSTVVRRYSPERRVCIMTVPSSLPLATTSSIALTAHTLRSRRVHRKCG